MFASILAVGFLAFMIIALVLYLSEDKPRVPTVDLWPDPRLLQKINPEQGTPVMLSSSNAKEVTVFFGEDSMIPLGILRQRFIYDMVKKQQLKAKVYGLKNGVLTLELLKNDSKEKSR